MIPAGLKKLVTAYPDYLDSADENNLYWKDGTVMMWDDGIEAKSHDEKLDSPDLEDMMSQKYTAGADWDSPPSSGARFRRSFRSCSILCRCSPGRLPIATATKRCSPSPTW